MSELDTWFILREPGCVPERKGPIPSAMCKKFVIELMEARPNALITVLTLAESGPLVQDGPEFLMMLDLRQRGRARRHIASTKAAFSAA